MYRSDILRKCEECLRRIRRGVELLKVDGDVRAAFRLANLAMLLQQIATKQLAKVLVVWDPVEKRLRRPAPTLSPWDVYASRGENDRIGIWRAFQVAFLLMQLEGMSDCTCPDREAVDLIWFPTGGGKTEAYLGVMAFYMFHQRLLMRAGQHENTRDGTNVLMRYTLRMLTTQQFQRAASLDLCYGVFAKTWLRA